MKQEILSIINERGYFLFSPEYWEKYGSTIVEMETNGEIIRCTDILKGFLNESYIYTLPNNLFDLKIIHEGKTMRIKINLAETT